MKLWELHFIACVAQIAWSVSVESLGFGCIATIIPVYYFTSVDNIILSSKYQSYSEASHPYIWNDMLLNWSLNILRGHEWTGHKVHLPKEMGQDECCIHADSYLHIDQPKGCWNFRALISAWMGLGSQNLSQCYRKPRRSLKGPGDHTAILSQRHHAAITHICHFEAWKYHTKKCLNVQQKLPRGPHCNIEAPCSHMYLISVIFGNTCCPGPKQNQAVFGDTAKLIGNVNSRPREGENQMKGVKQIHSLLF